MARGGGGGGRGGGFSGGSFRGGSSFRPTPRPVYHHNHPRPVHHHGPGMGRYPGGSGCGGCGCSGFFTLPILLFLMVAMLFGNSGNHAVPEPDHQGAYSERSLEGYAAEQYDIAFDASPAYEDNLLLTFLVYDDHSDFSYIAWVGDHINDATFALLGGNETVLGRTLERYVQYGYENTLSDDLSRAIGSLAGEIVAASPNGAYLCTDVHSAPSDPLVNDASLSLDEELLRSALREFTNTTGIPIVLVVEDAADIFG